MAPASQVHAHFQEARYAPVRNVVLGTNTQPDIQVSGLRSELSRTAYHRPLHSMRWHHHYVQVASPMPDQMEEWKEALDQPSLKQSSTAPLQCIKCGMPPTEADQIRCQCGGKLVITRAKKE